MTRTLFFGGALYELETQLLSIEEFSEMKKVTIRTVKMNLRRLGYRIQDFRLYKSRVKELARLNKLYEQNIISFEDFKFRDDLTCFEGLTIPSLLEEESNL